LQSLLTAQVRTQVPPTQSAPLGQFASSAPQPRQMPPGALRLHSGTGPAQSLVARH